MFAHYFRLKDLVKHLLGHPRGGHVVVVVGVVVVVAKSNISIIRL
jgi:hypothetical protein